MIIKEFLKNVIYRSDTLSGDNITSILFEYYSSGFRRFDADMPSRWVIGIAGDGSITQDVYNSNNDCLSSVDFFIDDYKVKKLFSDIYNVCKNDKDIVNPHVLDGTYFKMIVHLTDEEDKQFNGSMGFGGTIDTIMLDFIHSVPQFGRH